MPFLSHPILDRVRLVHWSFIAGLFCAGSALPAQTLALAGKPARLDEVIVTATRIEEVAANLPYATAAITRELLDERLPRTLPDALREESSIMVQKTSLGQGSPFIRGFTGFRTVLLIDGFRLNNAVFRDGPNQYWNTVDAWSLEKVELVKGPTSAQHGSDAVGGVVHARTVRPRYESGTPVRFASVLHRHATAERSHVTRVEAGGGLGDATALLAGGTLKRFGDLRGGRAVGVQPFTGYDETAHDLKLEHRIAPRARLTLAHQSVEQDDVWRTHATVHGLRWEGTRPGSALARYLDQGRKLTSARLDATALPGALREVQAGLAHHRHEEEEFRQRANRRTERQGFQVNTLGGYAHGRWDTAFGRWVIGAEGYRDNVDSFLREYDATGALATVRVQGPVADDARLDLLGVFAENHVSLAPRLSAILGGRFNRSSVEANKVATPGTTNSFALASHTSAFAANARLLYALDEAARWKLFAGTGQGVRAPNLSDLTRFDIAEAGQIETPVAQLNPERFLTGEVGLRGEFGRIEFETVYYHTWIDDLIVRTPTGLMVAGLAEVTKRNSGRGYIQGVEFEATARLDEQFSLRGVFTWMEGRLKSYPTAAPVLVEEPVSRLMPPTAMAVLRWQNGPWWAAASVTAAARADRLATQDRVDVERIPAAGTPGWVTAGLRAGWRSGERLTFSAALENIGDVDYRIHGSGLNEPGRNLVLMGRVEF